MSDKIYLVKCYHHDYYDISEAVHSAYTSRLQAEKAATELNRLNKNPIQDDGYGPYAGEEYVVEEIELRGLKCV